MHTICIIGGGFGAVKAAYELNRLRLPDVRIQLISDKPHFEYHARLYRVLTGRSPLEVCIPLRDIFGNSFVELVSDTVTSIDIKKKVCIGASGSVFKYDTLVVALGSEPDYYNTPGLKDLSFSMSSIQNVLRLKRHLHELFLSCSRGDSEEKNCSAHIVIVGGGATGIEAAGELAVYARLLAKKHSIDPSFVTVDLIHSGSRLMSSFPEGISEKIRHRLNTLGVNLFFNRRVMREELEQVFLKDMEMKTKTLIWCAGVKPHGLISQIEGLTLDKRGRVVVNEFMQAAGSEDVYVAGDNAATKYSGMAQTALQDGDYIASHIAARLNKSSMGPYMPKEPVYAVPVGPDWAVYVSNQFTATGKIGWWMRRYLDLRFFLSLLSFKKAFAAFSNDRILWETCPVCCTDNSC